MVDIEGFRVWAPKNGLSQGAVSKYLYMLRRIETLVPDGLDECLDKEGLGWLLAYAKASNEGIFGQYPSDSRSVVAKYAAFRGNVAGSVAKVPDADVDEIPSAAEAESIAFGLEREMQAAVRRQLTALEAGLVEADGGVERSVATGRIDILARDASGGLVIIELKAGRCPSSAIEQLLSYAQALHEELGEPIRTILIASEFSQKTLAAARWLKTVELKLYEVSVTFKDAI